MLNSQQGTECIKNVLLTRALSPPSPSGIRSRGIGGPSAYENPKGIDQSGERPWDLALGLGPMGHPAGCWDERPDQAGDGVCASQNYNDNHIAI